MASLADLFRQPAATPSRGRNGRAPMTKGIVQPRLLVPQHIPRPPYAESGVMPAGKQGYQVQDAEGVARMRASCRLAADILEMAGKLAVPGVRTEEIDAAVHAATVAAGAYPSPLNYGGFPKSVCTSINEVICHGIPDDSVLQEGDIVNIDVTVFLDGYHGDTSRTFLVGAVDAEAAQLVAATEQALEAGIAVCKPGAPFRLIGSAIHAVADRFAYGTCAGFCGHGVGRVFHSEPIILHCRNNELGSMAVGQTFTIEPMLTMTRNGVRERYWDDKWTAVTANGDWTAQFEHTLLITPGGCEVLTLTAEAAAARYGGVAGAGRAVLGAGGSPAVPLQAAPAPAKPAAAKHRRPAGGFKRDWNF